LSQTKSHRLAAALPTCLLIAGCGAQAPSDQAEASVDTVAGGAVSTPSSATAASHAVIKKTAATGWCSANEPVIFSCQLKSRKTISICGIESGEGAKTAQYRFGILGQPPELRWPEAGGKDRLTFASAPYSGGGEAQLSFSRGDVTYVVYSRIVRTNFTPGEPNDPAITDGIMVLKGQALATDLICSDSDVAPVDYELASEYADQSDAAFVIPGE
tara:strand:- start:2317 stop:2961 length:645 start_codon:yes stop_codon:yes gene_type:complete